MKQIKKQKKQESGRSMIEMVGVLAVMGLITAGAFVLISSAMKSQKTSRLDDDVSAIVAGVRLLYNSAENFSGLKNDALDVIGYGTDVKNPYGGNYYVAVDSADNTKFNVYVGGLSGGECKALKGRNFPGGGDNVAGKGAITVSNGALTVASGDCTATTATNSVQITYSKVQ